MHLIMNLFLFNKYFQLGEENLSNGEAIAVEIMIISHIKSVSFMTYTIKILTASGLFRSTAAQSLEYPREYSADCRPIPFQIVKFRIRHSLKQVFIHPDYNGFQKHLSVSEVHSIKQGIICYTITPDTTLITFTDFSGR